MSLEYSKITLKDLSRGIDARSSQNSIEAGFAEDLINVETNSQGLLSKRKGYEGYQGQVPLRIKEVEQDGTEITFCFDGVTNLLTTSTSPLVVYGKLGKPTSTVSGTSTDWDNISGSYFTEEARYYPEFNVKARRTLVAGSIGATLELGHEFGTSNLLTGITESTSSTTLSNELINVDNISIDKSAPNNVTYTYTLSGTSPIDDTEAFLYVADKTTSGGSSYAATFVAGDFTANVLTITAATHGLANINIIPQVFEDTGTSYDLINPDDITVLANGDIEITVSTTFDGKIVLSDVSSIFTEESGITGGSTSDIVINPTSGTAFFTAVYLREANGDRELIIPDTVIYNADDNTLTVSVNPPDEFDGNIQVIYEEANIIANCISVEDTTGNSVTFTDAAPQMTVWGISHDGIYPETSPYGGHVTHIDSYTRELEARVIAGLGGVFHTARTRAESGTEYLIPSSSISLNARVDASKYVGPFFVTTGNTTNITRAVTADNITGGDAVVTNATYTGTEGEVHFFLDLTNKVGTLAGLTTGDKLTVSNMAFRILNGTHDILAVDDSLNRITVSISDISTSDFDEVESCGTAGVFTDSLELLSTSPFLVDDELISNVFTGKAVPVVTLSSGTTVTMQGITSEISIPGGLLLRGRRTNTIVPLEDVSNFVLSDMCELTGFSRKFRVLDIDTTNNTVTIDEAIEFADQQASTDIFAVTGRWIPVEAPYSNESRIKRTYQQYLESKDYDDQLIVRSTMLQDSMFFTNGSDEVFKFDGSNIYRAGLQRWQPHLFVTLDNTVPAIAMPSSVAEVSGTATDEFTVDSTAGLTVGDQVVHDDDGGVYTISALISTTNIVRVNTTITGGASGALRPLRQLRYYFRLNAIDANQNIVASATVGSNDFIVNLVDDAQVKLKLTGYPTFDAYDYDRLEVKIYRADADINEFFQVGALDLGYDDYEGYVIFTDNTDGDEALTISDETTIILEGEELGNAWAQPLRAKYVTTASNKLILANVRDYPELLIEMRQSSGANISISDLTNKIFTLRQSGSSTTTDMLTTINYEWIDDSTAVSGFTIDNSSASSFSVASTAHGLSAGNWVYFYHNTTGLNKINDFSGWYQVASVTDVDNFVCNSNTGTTAPTSPVDKYITATDAADVPVLLGTDGNYNNNSGNSSLSYERLAMIRLANAINTTMSTTDTTISGVEGFIPWALAGAGDELGLGKINIRVPKADITTLNVTLPSTIADAEFIVNLEFADFSSTVQSSTRRFPSRIITSYRNFGEIFDGPYGLADDSANVFDISPADGQEITAVISFFGSAAFSASQVEDMLVVFKENSVHVVNLTTGETKKLETQGVGCSVPFSVAFSRNGIIFAHESGIYRLDKDLNISYVGKYIERLWQDEATINSLSRATATHYSLGRQYKLSLPVGSEQVDNNQVFVYDHTREADQRVEFGAWSRFDSHPATGWANLDNDAYFGTTAGDVFKIRSVGDETDYRDDAEAINQEIVYSSLDFGLPGVKKIVSSLVAHFQLRFSDLTGSQGSSAVDLSGRFNDLDSFSLVQDTNAGGLDGLVNPTVRAVKFSLPERRGEYFQIKFTNNTIDEDMRLSGLSFSVGTSSDATIQEAAET